MDFVSSATERTTALTDALLALTATVGVVWLRRKGHPSFARSVWASAFLFFGVAAALGTFVHGVSLDPTLSNTLWKPLDLCLGIAVALFATGAFADGWGEMAARRALPVMLLVMLGFQIATRLSGGNFVIFDLFEACALVLALIVYLRLAFSGAAGAWLIAIGLFASLVAGALQALVQELVVGTLDHNGIYHLVQWIGLIILLSGLGRLRSSPPSHH